MCGKSVAGEWVTEEVPGEVEEGEAGEVLEDLAHLGPVRHEVVREVELGHVARAGPQLQLAGGLDVVVDECEEGRELPRPRLGAAAHRHDHHQVTHQLGLLGVLAVPGEM